MIQPVNKNDQLNSNKTKEFCMIDNYIYLYHTDTLIAVPTYPESIQDSMAVNFSKTSPLSRSAPIYSYTGSGPRSFQVSLQLHRDMMNNVNVANTRLKIENLDSNDYVDILIKQLEAAALPKYAASEKMINPPIVAVKFGSEFFCKGVVSGSVSKEHSGPILRTDKYAMVTVSFTLEEIVPYDADTVMTTGGYRGFTQDLERRIYTTRKSSIYNSVR